MSDEKRECVEDMIPDYSDGIASVLTDCVDCLAYEIDDVCVIHRIPPQLGVFDRELCATYMLTMHYDFFKVKFPCYSMKGVPWDVPDVTPDGVTFEELKECLTYNENDVFLSWAHMLALKDKETLAYNSEAELRKKITLTVDAPIFSNNEERYEIIKEVVKERLSNSLELKPVGEDEDGNAVFDITHFAAQKRGRLNRILGWLVFDNQGFEHEFLRQLRWKRDEHIRELYITDKPSLAQIIKFH